MTRDQIFAVDAVEAIEQAIGAIEAWQIHVARKAAEDRLREDGQDDTDPTIDPAYGDFLDLWTPTLRSLTRVRDLIDRTSTPGEPS